MIMANPLDQLTTYTAENPDSLTASVARRSTINPVARRLNTVVAASADQTVTSVTTETTEIIGDVDIGIADAVVTVPAESLEALKQELLIDYIQPLTDVIANLESFTGDLEGTPPNAQIRENAVGIRELNVIDGTNGQVLATDGNGNLSFVTASLGGGGGGGGTFILPTATASVLGGVRIGSNITITNGVISVAAPFSGSYNDLTSRPTLTTGNVKTIAVSGQNNIVLAQDDTLTLVAGVSIGITTNSTNKSVTISSARTVKADTVGAAAYGLDCTLFNAWNLTLTASTATTVQVAAGKAPPNGVEYEMRIFVTYKANSSITFNLAGLKWPGNIVPAQTGTADKIDIFAFTTVDGGSIWYGSVLGQNF
jgi:hypothetical protein